MDDLQRRFLPRFLSVARERIEHGRPLMAAGPTRYPSLLGREMHALAGEALVMGLPALAARAQACGVAANDWASWPQPEREASCRRAFDELAAAVEILAESIRSN